MTQGCPLSPDLLNLVFSTFHRYTASLAPGVRIGEFTLSSLSFADDLALLASSWSTMLTLISAFLDFCRLIGLEVHLGKTQA